MPQHPGAFIARSFDVAKPDRQYGNMEFNVQTPVEADSGGGRNTRSPQPRSPRPTMAMVAKRVGVSTQTVSFALSTPDRLSPATLRKVLKAVDELGYRPNHAARSLRTRTPQAVGFRVFPAHRDVGGILSSYLYELSVAANAAGYGVFCHAAVNYQEEIRIIEETFRRNTVDCFVTTCTTSDDLPIPFSCSTATFHSSCSDAPGACPCRNAGGSTLMGQPVSSRR